MRVVTGIALLVALAALILAGVALRDAHHANQTARKTQARAQIVSSQLARDKAELARIAPTAKAVRALCYAARHASIPPATTYAVTVGRSIIQGIVSSCDYSHITGTP